MGHLLIHLLLRIRPHYRNGINLRIACIGYTIIEKALFFKLVLNFINKYTKYLKILLDISSTDAPT